MSEEQAELPVIGLEEKAACAGCGQTRREFYEHGRMGCAHCYEAFAFEVQSALKEIHGEYRHLGKNSA